MLGRGDAFFLVERDADGTPTRLIPLDVESVTIEGFGGDRPSRYVVRGYVDTRKAYTPPAGRATEQEPMPTGEAFLARFTMPELMSGPD